MNTKTIFINGRFLTQHVTGVQRYAINLLKKVDEQLFESLHLKIIILVPSCAKQISFVKLERIEIRSVGKLSGHLWEQLELPVITFGKLLVSLGNTSPIFKFKQVVCIYDAAVFRFPNAYKSIFVLWYRLLFRANKFNALKIFTISNFSKSEIIHFLGLSQEKIEVIYPVIGLVDRKTDNSILSQLGIENGRFLLTVGSFEKKKNLRNVVMAFEELNLNNFTLVVVGGNNLNVFSNVSTPTNHNVRYTGYITDQQLSSLYSNAYAFVFASLYEGFGLPPLESMMYNLPVAVSNAASLPEVCADAAIYFDPNSPSDIARSLRKLWEDKSLYNEKKRLSSEQVKKFTKINTGDIFIKLLNNVY